jgi:[acyl-carrier-protein] S-malonyltransferase
MEPAANRLRERLGGVSVAKPLIPVLQNCDVAAPESASEVKEALVRQLFCPVRWGDTVKALSARGVTHIVECGPGKVLAGLNKRISSELQSYALANGDSFREALSGLKG